jgi:hypothetical protein
MTDWARKYSPVFLAADDETLLTNKLKKYLANIRFIDGDVWESSAPPLRDSIGDCTSRIIFLWDPDAWPKLPSSPRIDGTYSGPTSGVVIQFARCARRDRFLLSGDLGIGYDRNEAKMVQFVRRAWRALSSLNSCSLSSVDPVTRDTTLTAIKEYVVGPHARAQCQQGLLLKHCAAEAYYTSE